MSTLRHSPSTGPGSPDVWGLYDPATGSVQYLVADPDTRRAAFIDVVQDFDPQHARTGFDNANSMLDLAKQHGLTIDWVLDTHPHADHFMASAYLKERTSAPNGIGSKTRDIASLWAGYYNEPTGFPVDDHFDHLFEEGDTFQIGDLPVTVWLSPGHTLGSITYIVGDAAFVHDTFMHVDSGTARADFPGGSSETLWHTLQRLLTLPDTTRLFVGHDYGKDGREPAWEATVGAHKANNIHLAQATTVEAFRTVRDARDATLPLPDRMLFALQVNLRAGHLPPAESDGGHYFRIPANKF